MNLSAVRLRLPAPRLSSASRGTLVAAAQHLAVLAALVAIGGMVWVYARGLALTLGGDDLSWFFFCRGIQTGEFALSDWRWCRNLYWFPDLLVYVPIYLACGNVMKIYAIFASAVFAGLVVAGWAAAGPLVGTWRRAGGFAAVFGGLLLLTIAGQPQTHMTYLLRPGWHGGAVLAGVVLIAVAYTLIGPRMSRIGCGVAVGMCFLGVPSDRLFASQFVAPVVAGLLWLGVRKRVPRKRAAGLAAAMLAAAVAGMEVQDWLRSSGLFMTEIDPPITWASIKASIARFRADSTELLRIAPFTALLGSLAVVLAPAAAVRTSTNGDPAARRWEFFAAFVVACLASTIAAPPVMGAWHGLFAQRFLFSGFVVGPLAVAAVAVALCPARVGDPVRIGLAGAVGFGVLYSYMALPVKETLAAKLSLSANPEVRFVNRLRAERGLTNGLANWEAKRTTAGCPGPYRVNPIQHECYVEGWYVNMGWFFTDRRPELGNGVPVYDFLIVRNTKEPHGKLKTNRITEMCGPPAEVITEGEYEAWVYDRPSDVAFRNFTRLYATVLAKRPLPVTAADRPELTRYKGDGYGWDGNAPAAVDIAAGGSLAVRLTEAVPSKNWVCELAVEFDDTYRVTFTRGGAAVGTADIPAATTGTAGMRSKYLLMGQYVTDGGPVDGVTVTPVSGRGPYRVGHVYAYEDSRPAGK